jgi:uncharacterized protein (TIGR03437 family)
MAAQILFNNGKQINLVVPEGLGLRESAQLLVTVDNVASGSRQVQVAPFAPAIFTGAVVSTDWVVNDISHGADPGGYVVIFATGLSGTGTVTARVHDREITALAYSGPAPGWPGVQQINLQLPPDLQSMTTEVHLCGTSSVSPYTRVCSLPAPVTLK